MIRRPPRSTQSRSSAASDVYKRQALLLPSALPTVAGSRLQQPPAGMVGMMLVERMPPQRQQEGSIIKVRVASLRGYIPPHHHTGPPPEHRWSCLLYTSPSPRDRTRSRMPSSA
eukprot:TRINITY_DN26218_c0_g1_i1.p1 TRINITY_DN26218_c0_g1~~TRINITY_DN26218_c0_g1_i1.p1  ORF type:complete len:114 (+),score=43.54 TRINITY_DN26218_c0_g1_i1:69-410(+)